MTGTMVAFSTTGNSEKQYSWIATKSTKHMLNKIKKQNQNDDIVIHKIQHITYDDFINLIENYR